jgi:hypothetical protein
MKSFQEFILEAEGDVARESAMLRAKAKMLRQKGDMKGALEVEMQAGELGAGTQAKISTATSDKSKEKPRENTWVSGKPSKGRDTRARGGSLPNIASSDGEGEGSIVSGKHSDTRTGRSGGVRGTLINRGTSRTGGTLGVRGKS